MTRKMASSRFWDPQVGVFFVERIVFVDFEVFLITLMGDKLDSLFCGFGVYRATVTRRRRK